MHILHLIILIHLVIYIKEREREIIFYIYLKKNALIIILLNHIRVLKVCFMIFVIRNFSYKNIEILTRSEYIHIKKI